MTRPTHTGFVALSALLLLLTFSSGWLLWTLNHAVETRSDLAGRREVLRGLRDAQLALIAHALIEDNTPGTLPAPSGENTLNGRSNPLGYTGHPGQTARRLPWHFLALAPRVGGECLWYVTSRIHRNGIPTAQRNVQGGNAINPATTSPLSFAPAAGEPAQPAAAIIIAPGQASGSQPERLQTSDLLCAPGSTSDFLEGGNALSNAPFASGETEASSADRVLPVLHEQLMRPVLRRVLQSFNTDLIRQAVRGAANKHPEAGTLDALRCAYVTGEGECPGRNAFDAMLAATNVDHLAYTGNCPGLTSSSGSTDYKHPVSWLCFNDWFPHIRITPETARLSINMADYACQLELETGVLRCANTSST